MDMMEYDDILAGLREMTYSDFAKSLLAQYARKGELSERQWDAGERAVIRHRETAQKRQVQRVEIDYIRIETLLFTARANGLKKPVFRACGMTFSLAPSQGKNAGAVYVKADGEYAGKLMMGRFHPAYEAPHWVAEKLAEVAADPRGKAIDYARETGICACCGRTLTDPQSIQLGIGPICIQQWGL